MSKNSKIPTDGGRALGQNPFGGLDTPGGLGSPPQPKTAGGAPEPAAERAARQNRGRVDVTREKAGRGGKTVTVVSGFAGIGLPEKEQLAKQMRAACGTGGTVKDGRIEIQGDKRDEVARILSGAGFRVVFAGG